MWALSYSEEVFSEPLTFQPDRWIVGGNCVTRESVELGEKSMYPFFGGPLEAASARILLGRNRHLLPLARVVHLFEIRRDPVNNLPGGGPKAEKNLAARKNPGPYQLHDTFVAQRMDRLSS